MIPQVISLLPHIHALSQSTFVFHYPGLNFIEAYSHQLIDILGVVAVTGAVLLAIGIFPRLGAALFMFSFGYLFLIDMSFYNNHYYLWCLFAFLFTIIETNRTISIIDLFKKNIDKKIQVNNYITFALMISIVFFYGGTAKLNFDWLQGYPMRLMTASKKFPFPDLTGYVISYTGVIYDLVMPFLLWRFARSILLIIPYITFHFINYFIFNIGEFPLVMIAAWLLFIPISNLKQSELIFSFKTMFKSNIKGIVLSIFFLFQIIIPMRALAIGGNVAWHRQGYNFSWRMMLNNYEPKYFQFLVNIPQKDLSYHVDFEKLLTYRQFYHLYHDPLMIWQLAQKLKKDAQLKYKANDVRVYCKAFVQLNQHPEKPLIDETKDLANTKYNYFTKNTFVNSF